MAGGHGLVSDVLRDDGLAEALVGDEDDVAGLGEEGETGGRLDGVGIDAFRPRPVEVGHRLEATEAGTGETALEPAITPATASGTCLWLAREVGALAH